MMLFQEGCIDRALKVLPLRDALNPMKSDEQHVNEVATRKELLKGSFVVRAIQGLLMICIAYFFIWVPWRGNRVDFLLFIGFGMIQVAGFYVQDLADNPTARITGPAPFPESFHVFLCSGLGLGWIGG